MVYNNRIGIRRGSVCMRGQGNFLLLLDMLLGRKLEGALVHVGDGRIVMPVLLGWERLLRKYVVL